jgi:integrase
VADLQALPSPVFWVARSQTEGGRVKVTKGRLARQVPLADVVLEAVRRTSVGKPPEVYLRLARQVAVVAFSVPGVQFLGIGGHGEAVARPATAACLWLTRGVDLSTASAWLGHASISTTIATCTISERPIRPVWSG